MDFERLLRIHGKSSKQLPKLSPCNKYSANIMPSHLSNVTSILEFRTLVNRSSLIQFIGWKLRILISINQLKDIINHHFKHC